MKKKGGGVSAGAGFPGMELGFYFGRAITAPFQRFALECTPGRFRSSFCRYLAEKRTISPRNATGQLGGRRAVGCCFPKGWVGGVPGPCSLEGEIAGLKLAVAYSSGGCSPIGKRTFRKFTRPFLLSFKASTVARPEGVTPIIDAKSALHLKWSFHSCRLG